MTTRTRISGAAAVLAAAALLTACSSGTSTSSGGAAQERLGAPGTAGPAPGGGWDCPGGTCSWGSRGEKGGSSGAFDEVATAERSTSAAPVTSVPSTTVTTGPGGALPRTEVAPAQPVTAGSVDDNELWDEYLRYRQGFDAAGITAERIPVEGRQVLTVVDRNGKGVLGARIEVRDGSGATVARLRTYADGRALFHPAIAADPRTQQRPTYTAVATKGDTTAEVRLTPEQRDYTIRLDVATATGPAKLDVLFLVDATGSMGDEIDRLKANIDAVAEKIAGLPNHPDVRLGMTVYRDRGDLFVTRTFDFTSDEAAFAEALGEVQADGGGDTPEDLDAGLHDALTKPSWRGDDTVKLVFLVADAPPHLDYGDGVSYSVSVLGAAEQGVKIFPIAASGLDPQGQYIFRQLAQITLARFVFLTYGADGRSPGDSTPHDIDRDDYDVLPLDELIVRLVGDEMADLAR